MFIKEEVIRRTEERAAARTSASPPNAGGKAADVSLREAALGSITGAPGVSPRRPGLLDIATRRRPSSPALRATASIATRLRHAEFGGAVPSAAELERFIGTNDLVDENYLERALAAARPVCRLTFKDLDSGRQAYATGFMVSPRLLLTNWHVFKTKDWADGAAAEFDYKLDIRGVELAPTPFALRPDDYFCSHEGLDFALVAVSSTPLRGAGALSDFGYHRLVQTRGKLAKDEPITIIQHPAGARRQIALRENELVEEPAEDDLFLWYRSDTARGSSGAPAFNDSWQVVALHHSGKARKENGLYVLRDGRRVASLEDIEETLVDWVANEGLRVSVLCKALKEMVTETAYRDELLAAMEGDGDIMTRAMGAQESASSNLVPRREDRAVRAREAGGGGIFPAVTALTLNASQINLAHYLTAPPAVLTPAAVRADAPAIIAPRPDTGLLEKLVQPIVDRKYSTRRGYSEDFLGISVPLPKITNKKVVSRMDDDSPFIPYQHFTVVMNKVRRLALFTASNVDGSPKARRPEPRPKADYTRDGLGGLREQDDELWLTDPRIPEDHQLPDRFFTKDRKSFDKGHVVRREDVCWGRTYATIRRANGDTFHTTNCAPQVAEFNRAKKSRNWGDLENLILGQAKTERLAVLAGPVFEEDDDVFEGVDDHGPVSVQIPRRYWKIVLARVGAALHSFAFILTQDLSAVTFEEEFAVEPGWEKRMIRVADLQDLLVGFTLPGSIAGGDQFGTADGDEVAVAGEAAKM